MNHLIWMPPPTSPPHKKTKYHTTSTIQNNHQSPHPASVRPKLLQSLNMFRIRRVIIIQVTFVDIHAKCATTANQGIHTAFAEAKAFKAQVVSPVPRKMTIKMVCPFVKGCEKCEYSWIINMASFRVQFWCPHRFENADGHTFTTYLTLLKLNETDPSEFLSPLVCQQKHHDKWISELCRKWLLGCNTLADTSNNSNDEWMNMRKICVGVWIQYTFDIAHPAISCTPLRCHHTQYHNWNKYAIHQMGWCFQILESAHCNEGIWQLTISIQAKPTATASHWLTPSFIIFNSALIDRALCSTGWWSIFHNF